VAVSERLRALGGDWRRTAATRTGQGKAGARQASQRASEQAAGQGGVPRRRQQVAVNVERPPTTVQTSNGEGGEEGKGKPDDLPWLSDAGAGGEGVKQ
jgi:hypothetical protein